MRGVEQASACATFQLLLRHKTDFFFDTANKFRRDIAKLNSDAHSLKAIANLAASLNHCAGAREAEAQLQHRALGILSLGVDKHSMGAEVRRAYRNVFFKTFVNHGKLGQ